MKHNLIRYSMIILFIGLVLTAGQAYAQGSQRPNEIELLSHSWGLSSGQAARVSVVNFGFVDGSVRTFRARIQLLDTEGDVIAQSGELDVAPGKIRFWDVPHDILPMERLPVQVRGRLFVIFPVSRPSDVDRLPLAASVELIDPSTGRSAAYMEFKLKEVLISGVIHNGDPY
jgi:prepilin-type processing-associated H-X9-DG protein